MTPVDSTHGEKCSLNVQSHYRKVTQGIIRNPEIFSILSLVTITAIVLLLLETAVIALFG